MTSWNNLTKNIASWANQIKNAALNFLLQEDGFYILQETGDKLILDQSGWTNQTKN